MRGRMPLRARRTKDDYFELNSMNPVLQELYTNLLKQLGKAGEGGRGMKRVRESLVVSLPKPAASLLQMCMLFAEVLPM